ncbi:MAG: hypothetical protein LBS68_00310, partial [Puniceicoccales bacterium]|nr:hypothetical protein [Puniceicoccales bacterium]
MENEDRTKTALAIGIFGVGSSPHYGVIQAETLVNELSVDRLFADGDFRQQCGFDVPCNCTSVKSVTVYGP